MQNSKRKVEIANFRKKNIIGFYLAHLITQFIFCVFALPAFAVPETASVRVSDVTTSSFSLVWITDIPADPSVEVYSDNSMQQRITEGVLITSMPAGSSKVAQAARARGIMKVRVSGAQPATTYYVRTVTRDSRNPDNVSYSPVQQATTASNVVLYRNVNNSPQAFANDLVAFPVYIQPSDASPEPGLGDLILVEEQGTAYPVTAFVGDGVVSPEGVLDLNNLFGADGTNVNIFGSEKMTVRIYRAGTLSTLTHYRKAPQNTSTISVAGLLKGFFADINLDGKIDDQDFLLFKAQYRSLRDDVIYNPDYNFVDDPDGKVDVREFSAFSKEYGRTNVQ